MSWKKHDWSELDKYEDDNTGTQIISFNIDGKVHVRVLDNRDRWEHKAIPWKRMLLNNDYSNEFKKVIKEGMEKAQQKFKEHYGYDS